METDIKIIQNKILEIAIYFDEFCKENGITYYLMGGSALGAIRHNGFIPWDDDLDVFMTYKNYMKFINCCEEKLDKSRFYLQKENTEEWPLFFSKLRMNNTTFLEEDTKGRKMHKGFYIDIMCLNNTTKNKFFRYIQYTAARIILTKTLVIRGYKTDSFIKRIVMKVTNLFVRGFIQSGLLKLVRMLNNKETSYVGHFFGRAKFNNTSFPSEYLGKQRYIEFSSIYLPVPEKAEKYLELRYGPKYMEMPDQKTKDMYPSHAVFVDPERDFSEYEK